VGESNDALFAVDGGAIWLPVVGWESAYEVSSAGQVRSLSRMCSSGHWMKGRILKPAAMKPYGHLHVDLWFNGARETRLVHHLVAEAFLGPRPPGLETRHLDGDPANNRIGNLIYGTSTENSYDMVRHGRNHNANKTYCDHGHEFTPENTIPNGVNGRGCRECRRRICREYMRRKRAQKRTEAA